MLDEINDARSPAGATATVPEHRQVRGVGRGQLGRKERRVTALRMTGQDDGVVLIWTDERASRSRHVEHRATLALADEVGMQAGCAEPFIVGRNDDEPILRPPVEDVDEEGRRAATRRRRAVGEARRAVRPAEIRMRAVTRLLGCRDHAADRNRLTLDAYRPIQHRPEPHVADRAEDLLRADDIARFGLAKRRGWLVEVRIHGGRHVRRLGWRRCLRWGTCGRSCRLRGLGSGGAGADDQSDEQCRSRSVGHGVVQQHLGREYRRMRGPAQGWSQTAIRGGLGPRLRAIGPLSANMTLVI